APAIPIRDLYHLIIDSKGQFSEARQRAIKMSEEPSIHHQNKRCSQNRQLLDNDSDDEILIKVDYNDSAFDWDNDEPAPEPVYAKKARSVKSKPKTKTVRSADLHH